MIVARLLAMLVLSCVLAVSFGASSIRAAVTSAPESNVSSGLYRTALARSTPTTSMQETHIAFLRGHDPRRDVSPAHARVSRAVSAAKAPAGAKRGPKPFGTGAHNLKIGEVADQVRDGQVVAGGQTGLPERLIPTPGGVLSGRRPDVLVQRPDGSLYGINVGRASQRSGAPIKREAEAINDLEGAGLEMHFVPYR